MASRFSPLRRARMQTQDHWLANALSDARGARHRVNDTLRYDEAFDGAGADAIEEQAAADGVTNDDIAAAKKVAREGRSRVAMLDAAALGIDDEDAAEELQDAARALQEACDFLARRIHEFARFAQSTLSDSDDDSDAEELTAEQVAALEDPPVLRENRRVKGAGAPYWDVSEADLERLFEMYVDWRWPQSRIADLLGCSTRKLRELFNSHSIALPRVDVDVAAIEDAVRAHMRAGAHGVGIRKMCGHLHATRVPHTWRAVAEAMARVDPVGRDQRYRRRVPRQRYNVKTVNGMWHFDGYEHLVTWNVYIEGAIDGASRRVLFLHATDNKSADMEAAFMIDAVVEYGVPHKLRSDCGKENVDVERFARLLREAGYKILYIKGPSTRNQRIERYWGDLCPYITPIATALQDLENDVVLDMTLVVHHMALHLVLLPYVNRVCAQAMDAWNHHRVSTADMRCTPLEKFAAGERSQRRQGRWQELFVEQSGHVAMAPAARAAAELRAARAGSGAAAAAGAGRPRFAPSEELEGIDTFTAQVIRDRNRVRTWRAPESDPAPWFSPSLRDAIAAAVTPLVPGEGVLRDELQLRFVRAVTYVTALDDIYMRGDTPSLHDVRALEAVVR